MSCLVKCTLAFLCLFCFSFCYGQEYRFERSVGLPFSYSEGQLTDAKDVSLGLDGNVYVANSDRPLILVFNTSGAFIRSFGLTGDELLSTPTNVATALNGNTYVADEIYNHDRAGDLDIKVFDKDGDFLFKFGSKGTADGQFQSIADIAIDEIGNVYVLGGGYIQVFTPEGAFTRKFSATGNALVLGPYGRTYTSTSSGINVYLSSGTLLRTFAGNATGLAFSSSGNIYASDYSNSLIRVFDPTGSLIKTFSLPSTRQFAMDENENIYRIAKNPDEIQVFDKEGVQKYQFGKYEILDGKLETPVSVATDKIGNIYVVDNGNSRIQAFNSDGLFLFKSGSRGSGDGQFFNPLDINIDDQEYIYVADQENHRFQVFNTNGDFIRKIDTHYYPTESELDKNGNIYGFNNDDNSINVHSNSGVLIKKFGSEGSGAGQFSSSVSIAVDNNGLIYVADIYNNRIQVLTSDGTFIRQFGHEGTTDGEFQFPGGIGLDDIGNIYVADTYNHRVQIFSNDGTFITKLGTRGSANGQFQYPIDINIDENKKLYVADAYNNRIQVFVPPTQSGASLTFTDLKVNYGDIPFSLNATSNSTGEISYSIVSDASNTGAVSLSGVGNKVVTILKAGKVKLRASVAATGSYNASSKDITLTINKATLTATANNASRSYGSENPAFSATYSGFKYNDNESVIDSKPVLSTIATSTTHWGSYPITPASGIDDSYDFSYVDGTLFVTKAQQTIFFDLIPDQLTTSPDFTLSASSSANLPVTFSISKGKDLVTLTGSTISLTGRPGEVTIVAYQEGNDYYHNASASQSFEITQEVVSGLNESINGIYVGPNPARESISIRSHLPIQKVIVVDLYGKLVLEQSEINSEVQLSTLHLTKGMYLLQLYVASSVITKKIVIE